MARKRLTDPAQKERWNAFGSREALAGALARTVAATLRQAAAQRGRAALAVSGGSTPAAFFRMLARETADWPHTTITLVDERFVPPSSDRSNEALVRTNLLRNVAAAATFVGLYSAADGVEQAAAGADALVRPLLPLDVAVLGMGADGHTASFFPDAANLGALLDPDSAACVLPVHAPSGGEPRLTLALARIVEAGFVALHIEGAEKRAVLERALAGEDLPIGAVFAHAGRPVEIFWAP